MSPTVALVSRSRLAHNMAVLQAAVGSRVKLYPALKANAYGHGASLVASVMADLGYTAACVAHVREASDLLAAEPRMKRLLVLAGMQTDEAAAVAALAPCVEPVVSTAEQLEALARAALPGRRVPVHVKLDTGMSRQGASPSLFGRLLSVATGPLSDRVVLRGVMTHLAAADAADPALTLRQLVVFRSTLAAMPPLPAGVERHVANSAGILSHPESHWDACRPGIAVYGLNPGEGVAPAVAEQLKPALELRSRVSLVKTVPRGTGVSYGHHYVTQREKTVLATVAAGYGDGLGRVLSGRMSVFIHGVQCPQLGRVTMDQIVVDATEVPPAHLSLGSAVTLLGPGVTADELAAHAGTINYEIVTGISARVQRQLVA